MMKALFHVLKQEWKYSWEKLLHPVCPDSASYVSSTVTSGIDSSGGDGVHSGIRDDGNGSANSDDNWVSRGSCHCNHGGCGIVVVGVLIVVVVIVVVMVVVVIVMV